MAERPGTPLILKRASASRSSGQWRDDDYDVLENGVVVGRIFKVPVAPPDRPWMWASGHNGEIRRAAHGYEATREAAMAAFAKSWRRESASEEEDMRKLLLATVALMLAMPAAATTDYCAVVKKTPDGFLALREQPTVKSYLWTKLRPGTLLVIDDTSEDQCEENGRIRVCPTDGWSFVHTIPELDDGKPTPTQGWVATRYTRPVP